MWLRFEDYRVFIAWAASGLVGPCGLWYKVVVESCAIRDGTRAGEPALAAALEGKKILVADHDEHMVAALAHLLIDAGAAIETAYDGIAAAEKAEEFDPDLVILGATLPRRSGYLVLEQLKRPTREGGRAPFVIMITHIKGKRHQLWAEGIGADGYFHKPIRMDHLVERVKGLLSG